MNQSMLTASVTMGQLQKRLDTISNNLANSDTVGFKARQAKFSDLLYQQIHNQPNTEASKTTPDGIRVGSGVKVSATTQVMTQGSIKVTDRSLDIALLEENLLFEIIGNPGEPDMQFTRSGAFYLSPIGGEGSDLALVTADGRRIMGQNGPITLPADTKSIEVDKQGAVQAVLSDETRVVIDNLSIVQALKPQYLQATGDNTFQIDPAMNGNLIIQAYQPQNPVVQQGALEQSNVDTGQEMVQLLETQRAFQLNAKSITYANDMMGIVNSIR
jgi:flagellar basal-body rod protein FlgG